MQIENNLTLLTSILNDGHNILFSADGIWGLSCNGLIPKARQHLIENAANLGDFVTEFLVADIKMLKSCTDNLHPRIETLLHYHERPIRIKCKHAPSFRSGLTQDESYFRIVKDKASRILINEVNFPIFFVSFVENGCGSPLRLEHIKIDQFDNVKFIASQQEYEEFAPLLSVSFDDEGLIEVLE